MAGAKPADRYRDKDPASCGPVSSIFWWLIPPPAAGTSYTSMFPLCTPGPPTNVCGAAGRAAGAFTSVSASASETATAVTGPYYSMGFGSGTETAAAYASIGELPVLVIAGGIVTQPFKLSCWELPSAEN
ncbi:hypothetical protein SUGI_1424360 [Cryptomeria japonica]|uniref:Uncharacterized protein n=1 Tax=Cryptomeria japonica TaxID=3369 RepID=A0AAD3NRZ9_CRYJA|nr:hypothetical protein SUGI_1424360 [Cryptomeria japonica]